MIKSPYDGTGTGKVEYEDLEVFKDQHAPGAKLDSDKIQTDLLLDFGLALTAVADLGTTGSKKYSEGGWKTVQDGIKRYTAAMTGHMLKERFEDVDSDTKIPHAVATAWNSLARLQLMIQDNPEWVARLLKRTSTHSIVTPQKAPNHSDD